MCLAEWLHARVAAAMTLALRGQGVAISLMARTFEASEELLQES